MRHRLVSLAALAAVLLSAHAAAARIMPVACTVSWASVSRITIGDDDLSALVFTGSYRGAGEADFTVMDDDGLLTLAILMNQWQLDGRFRTNLTAPVALRRTELELAQRAARIGTAYQASLLRSGPDAGLDQDPEEYEARQEFFRSLAAQLRGLIAKAGPNGATVPAGFLRDRVGTMLERMAPGAAKPIKAYYIDPAKPDVFNPFCDPKAPNALVGQIPCSRSFVTGDVRPGTPCMSLGFADVSALPVKEPEAAPAT